MTRGKRHNLMVDKFVVRSGHKLADVTFMNNFTREITTRLISASSLASVSFVELKAPHGTQLGNIKFKKILAVQKIGEKLDGSLGDLVAMLKPDLTKHLNVLHKLLDPGVAILFVPNRRPKPGSEQRATLFGPTGKSLEPFDSAELQLEVGGQEATIFENFGVGPSGMFVNVFVMRVRFALK